MIFIRNRNVEILAIGLCLLVQHEAFAFTGADLASCKQLANVKEWKGTYTLTGKHAGSGAYTEADGGQATVAWDYASSFSAQMIIKNYLSEPICAIFNDDLPLSADYTSVSATASFHYENDYPADNGTGQIVHHTLDRVPNGSTPTLELAAVAEVNFSWANKRIEITTPVVGFLPTTETSASTHFPTVVSEQALQLNRNAYSDSIVLTMPSAGASSLAMIDSRTVNAASSLACGLFPAACAASGGTWTETWELYPTFQDGSTEKPRPKPVEDPCLASGSIIGCENQSLGEAIAIAGTPYRLHYQSDRTPGTAGASTVAIAYASDLGGWTLDAHHRYDPATNTLFLGTGAFRSSASLGTVTPSATSGFLLIASEDGLLVYEFNADGVHTRTLNALTGATLLTFAYDPDPTRGWLLSVTDGNNNVTTFTRNAQGKLTTIVGPYLQASRVTLDKQGYITSLKDPAGKSIKAKYTAKGLLTAFTNARGMTSTLTYNADGLLLQDKNPAGGKQTLARSSDGNTVTRTTTTGLATSYQTTYQTIVQTDGSIARTVTEPTGLTSTMNKSALLATSVTTSNGVQIAMTPASDARFGNSASIPQTTTTTTPGGLINSVATTRVPTLASADPLSLTGQTETLSLNGKIFTSSFDAASKTFTETSPSLRQSTSTIDSLGRVTNEQVAGLNSVSYVYDAQGRLTSISSGSGGDQRTTQFTYDAQGYLQTTTDLLGQSQSYVRDKVGRVVQQTLPDGNTLKFAYDADGNLLKLTNPAGKAYSFSYNKTGLLGALTLPAAKGAKTKESYTYNLDGQMTGKTRLDGTKLAYGYDTAGRLNTLTAGSGVQSLVWNYGYDATRGYLNTITEPGGISLGFTRDGQLLQALSWTGPVAGQVGFSYNSDFQLQTVSVNNADPITYGYDTDGLLISAGAMTLQRNNQNTLRTGTTLGSVQDSYAHNGFGEISHYQADFTTTALLSVDYVYDKLGRITQRTESLAGGTAKTTTYTYDLAGQLSIVADGTNTTTYGYDKNGNRLTFGSTDGTTPSATGSYDAQDRLLSYGNVKYGYNANGEVNSRTVGSEITKFEYNVLGNLVAAVLPVPDGTRIDYLVDGAGRRVGKKVNGTLQQGFLYQDSLKPVAELDGSGTIVSRFVYATHVNVPDYMIQGGVTYRILTDHLGSPRLVVNTSDGTVAQRMDYDEFGNVLQDTNPGFQPFGFAGGLYDADTKLIHYGAREFDPRTGRWMARDPIGFEGGGTNLYAYAGNDPVNFSDSNGEAGVKVGGTLYVKSKDVALLKEANVTAERYVHLQPGDQVTWLGHVPSSPFEKVGVIRQGRKGTCEAAVGYVLQQNLSTKAPSKEISDGGKPMDSQVFPSHGAGTKG